MPGRVLPPWWSERPVFVIGGGPSLRGHDLEGLRSKGHVLSVNAAAFQVDSDALFSRDNLFAKRYRTEIALQAKEREVYLAMDASPEDGPIPGATYLRRDHNQIVSLDPEAVADGKHSGFGAISLAILKGARRIVLLGYDLNPPSVRQRSHWHDTYAPAEVEFGFVHYPTWARAVDQIAEHLPDGVEVVNANPQSAVRAFPFSTYERELA